MVVDCRSLIEFCRAFEQHRNMADHHHHHRGKRSSKSSCEHSSSAAVDVVLLLLVLGAFAVLSVPCFKFILREASDLLPAASFLLLGDVVCRAPVAYAAGFFLMFAFSVAAWEIVSHQCRKCNNPYCKGLRKAVEFDIQLESEECIRYLPPVPTDAFGPRPLELGEDHKELEAELKKMAPLNGRTVLIFRAPCGCPAGRMEVWGAKKVRRIKK